jgi:hypothetical protein
MSGIATGTDRPAPARGATLDPRSQTPVRHHRVTSRLGRNDRIWRADPPPLATDVNKTAPRCCGPATDIAWRASRTALTRTRPTVDSRNAVREFGSRPGRGRHGETSRLSFMTARPGTPRTGSSNRPVAARAQPSRSAGGTSSPRPSSSSRSAPDDAHQDGHRCGRTYGEDLCSKTCFMPRSIPASGPGNVRTCAIQHRMAPVATISLGRPSGTAISCLIRPALPRRTSRVTHVGPTRTCPGWLHAVDGAPRNADAAGREREPVPSPRRPGITTVDLSATVHGPAVEVVATPTMRQPAPGAPVAALDPTERAHLEHTAAGKT